MARRNYQYEKRQKELAKKKKKEEKRLRKLERKAAEAHTDEDQVLENGSEELFEAGSEDTSKDPTD